jgi:hypothetical protein
MLVTELFGCSQNRACGRTEPFAEMARYWSKGSKVPMAIPAVIATGFTSTMLTFAQNSLLFCTVIASHLRIWETSRPGRSF